MLRIVNFEEIQAYLDEVSVFVDLYEKKDAFFADKVKHWLRRFEKVLENNHIPIVSQISGYRAMLISAEQGIIPGNIQFTGQVSRKKVVNATASFILQQVADGVLSYLQNDQLRFAEAERQTRQLISILRAKGLIQDFEKQPLTTEVLKNIWQVIKTDTDLMSGAINVEGLVGKNDCLIILNRELTIIPQH